MIGRHLTLRIFAMAALALVTPALGGCLTETGDVAATTGELINLTEFVGEFLRSALAAFVL